MPVGATVPVFLAGAYDTGTIEGPLLLYLDPGNIHGAALASG